MELSADDRALARQLFDDIDEDKSGVVDKGEMRQFLQLLPGNRTESDIAALFKGGDQDGSGTIEFDEFVSILTQAMKDVPTEEISRTFREAKEKSKEQMKSRRAMFEAKGSSSPPPAARKAPPPPPPPATATEPSAPSVDEAKYQRQIDDLQRQLEQAKTKIRDLEFGQSKPCDNCARLKDELSKASGSGQDRTRQLERELRDLHERFEKQQKHHEEERAHLQQHADSYRAESEHYQHELKTQEQTKCPQCLAVAKQQRLASGSYSPPTSPRDPTLALVGVQPRRDRGWSALSGSRRTTYCMGCGNAHRWAATPFVKEYSNRPGAGDAVEFYCRCCKKVNPRELRAEPPHQEQIRYPFTQGLYWYCSNCAGREPAGRPLGTTVPQNCSRCNKQATFEVREVPPARLIQMNKAAERALYCRGCREEECAMRWEPEGKEVELYCNKCRGVMAWEVRRRRV